jgi:hypothetical protein
MKLENNGITHLDLGFEVPQPGISIIQFEEGISKQTNEKSGKTTLRLPLIIDRVIEGPEENAGKKMSHFVPIETEFGERQLAGILNLTGLMPAFTKNFGQDVDVQDEKFLNALKLKLPGKIAKVHHGIRQDNKGKDQVNITRLEKADGKGVEPSKVPAGKPLAQQAQQSAKEDWD